MDFKEIIRMGLEEYMEDLHKALDGLTLEERRFQPSPEAHHIDFAVWHMARVEDGWINSSAQSTDQVWRRDGWHRKLAIPEGDSGFGYTAEQVANLPQFQLEDVMTYYGSVRQETLRYLDRLRADDLETRPHSERWPDYTIGRMFSHILVEESQHVGQVAYLRGIQRGLNN